MKKIHFQRSFYNRRQKPDFLSFYFFLDFNIVKPFNIALKNGNLYFCDFASNENFLEYLFPMYHTIHNTKDLINDYQRKKGI